MSALYEATKISQKYLCCVQSVCPFLRFPFRDTRLESKTSRKEKDVILLCVVACLPCIFRSDFINLHLPHFNLPFHKTQQLLGKFKASLIGEFFSFCLEVNPVRLVLILCAF